MPKFPKVNTSGITKTSTTLTKKERNEIMAKVKQNTNNKQNILKSYDLLLNKKYNVVINEKTIERVKNFFK